MISYELAKRLKDKGFPQDKCSLVWKGPQIGLSTDSPLMIPTLSELIEACGEGFNDLMSPYDCVNEKGKYVKGGCKEGWQAMGSPYVIDKEHDFMPEGHWPIGIGGTPEEAVVHLWLALQEDKK